MRPDLPLRLLHDEQALPRPHRLLFVSHRNWYFVKPLIEVFAGRTDVTLRTLELNNLHDDTVGPPRNDKRTNAVEEANQAYAALDWADTVFVEWCSANAVWMSRNIPPGTHLIVRLHSSELNVLWPGRMDWENVNRLIFVAPHTRDRAIRELRLDLYPHLEIDVIGNLRDLLRFDRPKRRGADRRLGMIGYRTSIKNPRLAVAVLEHLHYSDPSWELHFVGRAPSFDGRQLTALERARHARESAYYEAFYTAAEPLISDGRIQFHSWSDDVPHWFEKIGFILSCSDYEGTHEAVIEGMASGAVPVVRRWQGAERIYPESLLFSEAEEAASRIAQFAARGDDERQRMRDAFKQLARQRFDGPTAIGRLERAILGGDPAPVRDIPNGEIAL